MNQINQYIKHICYTNSIYVTGNQIQSFQSQQFRDWAKLGFIRSIAVTSTMCKALSTSQWVDLLLRLVSGSIPDDERTSPTGAVNLPRQVNRPLFLLYPLFHVIYVCNSVSLSIHLFIWFLFILFFFVYLFTHCFFLSVVCLFDSLSVCLSVYLFIHLFIWFLFMFFFFRLFVHSFIRCWFVCFFVCCLIVHLSVVPPACLFAHSFVCLSVHCLIVHLSVCLSARLFVSSFVCLVDWLIVRLSVCLSAHLFIRLIG